MNFIKISKQDTANGLGIGVVLWVAGCTHHCEGCHNPGTWDASEGEEFTQETLDELIHLMENPHIHRFTFSGGDPLAPYNMNATLHIAQVLRQKFPEKKIWCYTGFSWEQVKDSAVMRYLDVLVDGKFVLGLKDISLHWCGSSNQRVIDVQKSIQSGEVFLLKEDED